MPFGIREMNSLVEFIPPHLITMSCVLILESVTTSTLSNYVSRLLNFCKFGDNYNIPESFCIPASEALLTMFITCGGGASVSSSTMHHWPLGLELSHKINSALWLSHSMLKQAIKVTAFHCL